MNFTKALISHRLVTVVHKFLFNSLQKELNQNYLLSTKFHVSTKIMAQRSITSFFKVSLPKNATVKEEENKQKEEIVETKLNGVKSPDDKETEKQSSKRSRLESSGSETEISKSPKLKSEKKKKVKRQRIESSGSESELIKLDNQKSPEPEKHDIKNEETKSPAKVKISTKKEEAQIKVEKSYKPKTYESPKSKKRKSNALSQANKTASPSKKDLKKTDAPKKSVGLKDSPKKSSSPDSKPKVKEEVLANGDGSPDLNKENEKVMIEVANDKDDAGLKVEESEYNPAKAKYHPIKDACWGAGQPVPYLALTQTLEAIEATSARLKIIEILANYFRSVIALTPDDLLPSVYMCLNKLAPAYHSLELGIAETYLLKAVGQCTGLSLAQTRAAAARAGDLGAAAAQARASQRTMFAAPKLTARNVFKALKEIAHMTGHASVNKKISKIQSLFVACRHSEAKFLIRSLEGKLRIGLAEQSVLQALALATALTPPDPQGVKVLDASKGLPPDVFKRVVDEHALTLKTSYCECPNYEAVLAAALRHGVAALPAHCRLAAGVPLKPMLAHPTRGVHEIFNRFEGIEFTCEWKYDGERAQIHVPEGAGGGRDLARAAVFSRNQEDNTSKYPDVLRRLPALLKDSVSSCVLDCEAVAYDPATKQILPFQVLSTRKRKGAAEADIKVQVCVFVFDVLLLNGAALVRRPLRERRRLLRDHFNELEGAWQFATSRDCSSMEEVQQFLEEAVRGSCEGLMVKTLTGDSARYDIARRSRNWLKLKKDYLDGVGDTIDVVVLGAYWGRGRRRRAYGGFLAAARDDAADGYQALCKLGTGFTDQDLADLSKELDQHIIDAPRSYYSYDASHAADVWFSAAAVWEVRCADLSLSPAHRAAIGLVDRDRGISLRFPRFIRVRTDKSPEQATSARQIADMYLAQDQVKNQPRRAHVDYDDFY